MSHHSARVVRHRTASKQFPAQNTNRSTQEGDQRQKCQQRTIKEAQARKLDSWERQVTRVLQRQQMIRKLGADVRDKNNLVLFLPSCLCHQHQLGMCQLTPTQNNCSQPPMDLFKLVNCILHWNGILNLANDHCIIPQPKKKNSSYMTQDQINIFN